MTTRPMRGVDHIGVTVPDIEAATTFLVDGCGARLIYESFTVDQPPQGGAQMEANLNLAPGTKLVASRMIKLGDGPGIELFELAADDQRPPARPSDFGMQHLALYVDDMDAAIARFETAGGRMFSAPQPFLFPMETGPGNLFCYGQAPWGMMIEFITYPAPMGYEQDTDLRLRHAGS